MQTWCCTDQSNAWKWYWFICGLTFTHFYLVASNLIPNFLIIVTHSIFNIMSRVLHSSVTFQMRVANLNLKKFLCPSSRGESDDSETPLKIHFFMCFGRDEKTAKNMKWCKNWTSNQSLEKIIFWYCNLICQNEQFGCVLELSRTPLEDGHRDFKNPRLSNTLKMILINYGANCNLWNHAKPGCLIIHNS